MKRTAELARRLREVLLTGRWIANTNCKEQILLVNWQQSVQKPQGLNSIAALVFHLNYYMDGLLRAFENGHLDISDRFSFDMPPVNSKEEWEGLVEVFLNNSERFAAKIEGMEEGALDQPFVDERYGTLLMNIESVLEHTYYHLGQIVLIRKLVQSQLIL